MLTWIAALCAAALLLTAAPGRACIGDCNGDARVTIDELLRAVQVALGNFPADACDIADNDRDGVVNVDELVRAVGKALTTCSLGAPGEVLLSTGEDRLDERDLGTGAATTLVPATRARITGQPCVLRAGAREIVVGDRTGDGVHGWSLFSGDGTFLASLPLSLAQDGQTEGGEPVGCAVAADGRIFTTARGTSGGADGQLRVYFPPDYDFGCLIDGTLRSPGQIAIDESGFIGAIYVPESVPGGAVLRFDPPFPADPNECELSQGVPQRPHEPFIELEGDEIPHAVVRGPRWWHVAATTPAGGAIFSFSAYGTPVGPELAPGSGGTPVALAIDGKGALYYADAGLDPATGEPVPGRGTLRRLVTVGTPELVASGLSAPSGVAVTESRAGEWLTLGGGYRRTYFNPREWRINRDTADQLVLKWRYFTSGMISGQPVVTWVDLPEEGRTQIVIISSWDRSVYALRAENGSRVWSYERKPQPGTFYPFSGSPTVAWVDGQQRVYVPGGETMYCLDATTGEEIWQFDAGTGCTTCRPSQERNQIESTPAVVNGLVIAGMDVNDSVPGKGGLFALSAGDGRLVWWFDLETGSTCRPFLEDEVRRFDGYHDAAALGLPEDFFATRPGCDFDRTQTGCGNVWSSPAVDLRRNVFYVASSNCDTDNSPETPLPPPPMPPYDEAIFALTLSGDPVWVWRPREVDNADLAFGAVPNLFEATIDGAVREVVGIGNKDGTYYVLDRDGVNELTGVIEPYWSTNVVPGGPAGGMIGSASVGEDRVVVCTAPGFDVFEPQRPTVHAFDAATGEIMWQRADLDPCFGPTAGVPGLAITGGTPRPFLNFLDRADGALLKAQISSTAISGISSAPTIVDGTIFVGGGTGAFNEGMQAATEATRDTPLSVFCVAGTPGCTPHSCSDANRCTYEYRDASGACASEPAADGLDCVVAMANGRCVGGTCVPLDE